MHTTTARPRATAPTTPAPTRRGAFAREAALDAFGRQVIHHLSDPEPESGTPDDMIDGRQVVARWLSLAASLEGEEAEIARQTADELCRVLGLSQDDVTRRTAARG